MDSLFPGDPVPLPSQKGPTWVSTAHDPPKPEVRHAVGYAPFLQLAADFGTPARELFDLWRFAHFTRAHAAAFRADPGLQHSAVVFLGNSLIATHQDLVWQHHPIGLVVENKEPAVQRGDESPANNRRYRRAGVQRIVEALLEADEQRFDEFHDTVDMWQPQDRH